MNQNEKRVYLIKYLKDEHDDLKDMDIPQNEEEQKSMLRSLMNIRSPKPVSNEFIKVQDEYLQEENKNKGIVTLEDIEALDKISLWQGDITKLKVGAIVNAANSRMLGCFVPCHKCIDNVIHSAAGIELREACYEYMEKQREKDKTYFEPTGSAVITSAYNLPCDYVIHTVGPIVSQKVTENLREDLKSCYISCLQCAVDNNVRSIAFCCISTGEFHFPNDEAAQIAVNTVKEFLESNEDKIDRVIFNVYKDIDLDIYNKVLEK